MKKRIEMMVSSALVGFGMAVLVLPLCLSGMRMLAEVIREDSECHTRECTRERSVDDWQFNCINVTCTAQGGPCRCLPIYVSGRCSCVNYPWIPEQNSE